MSKKVKQEAERETVPFDQVVKRLLGTPPTTNEGKGNAQSAAPKKRAKKRAKR